MEKFKQEDDRNIKKLAKRADKGVHSHTVSPFCGAGNQLMLRLLKEEQATEEPMPDGFIDEMEADYGIGLGNLKLWRNKEPNLVKQRAYARGNEIHIASDFPAGTGDGRRILRHEMAHVIQQGNGWLGGRFEAEGERQAHEGAVRPGPDFRLPTGTSGYPAQGIDPFEIEVNNWQLFQPVKCLIDQFNENVKPDTELTPESRQGLFRLLNKIDTAVYQLMNSGMEESPSIYLKEMEGYAELEKILGQSRKLYEDLTKQVMDNRQLDDLDLVTEIPVSLDGRKEEDIKVLKQIWTSITAPGSNIVVGNEAVPASTDFSKQIYGYIGKMLHYKTGADMLSAVETGEKKIVVTESGGGGCRRNRLGRQLQSAYGRPGDSRRYIPI